MRVADFDLALVLSGGAALGAYQGGVYEALHEAGLRPGHVAGTSIGAINGALIAGNPPDQRLERLRRFWAMVAEPGPGGPPGMGSTLARAQGYLAALRARLAGRPGLYLPQFLEALGTLAFLAPPRPLRSGAAARFHARAGRGAGAEPAAARG